MTVFFPSDQVIVPNSNIRPKLYNITSEINAGVWWRENAHNCMFTHFSKFGMPFMQITPQGVSYMGWYTLSISWDLSF